MNVYDLARNLATAIKDSEELKQYEAMKSTVSQNEEITAMINDFQGKQMEMQTMQLTGQEIDAEFTGQIQQLYGIMMSDPLAAQYLQAELRFSLMMNDIYKILGEVIAPGSNQ
ncbi:YlbF family regulator [Aminipila butyrica]|uniref:YlbF family regulator n=1 Tax=Aminipila butyrica TaxID=433296 RepID=A0A858BV27_9FIRM|nr:YlbF family regulator [Aminipila butyrica]QIB69447.1 YlbF family regulator [Aminipila butyrica]